MQLISPEQIELEKRLADIAMLEKQLAEKELELHLLEAELNKFNIRYKAKVGRLYATLDAINAEIATLECMRDESPELKAFADEAIRQAKQSAFEAGMSDEEEKLIDEPPVVQTEEIKQLFRKAAMKIHPDRTTNEAEKARRTQLMSQLNKAYDAGDLEAIQKLINEANAAPDEITGSDVGSKLIKAIRQLAQIQNRLADIEKSILEIKQSEDYELMKSVISQEKKGLAPLNSLAAEINAEIVLRKAQLDELKGLTTTH